MWLLLVETGYIHLMAQGGSLEGAQIIETVTLINWPFREAQIITGGSTTLDASGKMVEADDISEPGWKFNVNDFLPSPPKAGLPQSGSHSQEWDWICPMCWGVRRDIEQGAELLTFTLQEDAESETGYIARITTGYNAAGEPVDFTYYGEPLE